MAARRQGRKVQLAEQFALLLAGHDGPVVAVRDNDRDAGLIRRRGEQGNGHGDLAVPGDLGGQLY
jgi:hypothetical protein